MRQMREERNLSQAEVASRMGTSQAWVARMESGKATFMVSVGMPPSWRHWQLLSNVGVPTHATTAAS